MMKPARLNILASAYKCTPDMDSEAEVGWQWVLNLGKLHHLTVITRKHRDADSIMKLIEKAGSSVKFEYYELPSWLHSFETGSLRHFIYYSLWQIGAFFLARKIVKRKKFDLVQHFVFVNTWQPTYMAFLSLPFFFGPIGEHPQIPYNIARHYGIRIIIREYFKWFIKHINRNYNPLMKAIYDKASIIIVINNDVFLKMPPRLRCKILIHPAIGVDTSHERVSINIQDKKGVFRVLFVGRFVYYKGPDIALQAFLKFAERKNDVELTMIGGGKMLKNLKKIIDMTPGAPKIKILGWVSRNVVMEYMKSCDVFLFPTLEGGGMVVLEAMSFGKPVVCLDFGGPAEFITEESGVKVKVTNLPQMVTVLSEALEKLYSSETLRFTMGMAAKNRVEELYSWEKKALWMSQLYQDVLSINT